ncbi:MAG TPA: guanylyltransferase [Campylobacterales bacterium]|nr:guanylyltransferase [Campylobacterales bacterium]
MKFDDLDKKMRVYETTHDHYVMPEMYIVARIDGRSFTRLTKEIHKFETPFDAKMRDYMTQTVEHLMTCGFKVLYGYTQSDEISLLFAFEENTFHRKERKLNSILAGEASAKFSLLLGDMGAFDCRVIQLPNLELVENYFRWRQEDAKRNSLNGHCYWTLRDEGMSGKEASAILDKLDVSEKNELLFSKGTNFNDVPSWQKRGVGVYWETYEKEAFNPKTNEKVMAERRRLKVDSELPIKDAYGAFIYSLFE